MLKWIFRRKNKKKEQRTDDLIGHWEYPLRISDLAEALGVSDWSVRNFLKRKKLYEALDCDERGVMIKKDLFDRILGIKSSPPERIDELEYDYPASWLAKKAGISSRTVKRWIKRKGIVEFCKCDGRGIRIPRSICEIIWPQLGQEGR